jgi:hypothetical protein
MRSSAWQRRFACAGLVPAPSRRAGAIRRGPEPVDRTAAVASQATPAAVLYRLTHGEEPQVRAGAAGNWNLSRGVLETLLSDTADSVRTAAMKSQRHRGPRPGCGSQTRALPAGTGPGLTVLAQRVADKRAEVKMDVAFNPAADADLLRILGGERRSAQVRRSLAANPNTPAKVLRALADDKDDRVRQAVTFRYKHRPGLSRHHEPRCPRGGP